MRIRRNNIHSLILIGILLPFMALITACDSNDESGVGSFDSNTQIVLTFVTSNDGTSTRSAAEDPDGYEAGVGYENYIDFDNKDYKIYFFTNTATDTKGGTLIAEFKPDDVSSVESNTSTTYTITGNAPTALIGKSYFRVVMLANWGVWYPSVEVGKTTIDDLCEGAYTTYNAKTTEEFELSATNLIPFYGVQEYSGVPITAGSKITLPSKVNLLRAMAKVEVVLESEATFTEVSIVNYNSQGYCAPSGVYTAADYDTDQSKNPTTSDWGDEYVTDLHLVGGANDSGTKSMSFLKTQDRGTDANGNTLYETWVAYLPEYNNMVTDYSYINVKFDYQTSLEDPNSIYFADYTNGATTSTADYNIKRNNLYRFYVTLSGTILRVVVDKWENTYDNEFDFGQPGNDGIGEDNEGDGTGN